MGTRHLPARSWGVDRSSQALDTANGELTVDKCIDLYAGALGERIAALVLDSTPNVLSLGRSVVDQGYTWHWDGYTVTP